MSIRVILLGLASAILWTGLTSAGHAQYQARWDQLGGGWSTGWVRQGVNMCGHYAPGCSCGSANYCGLYQNGSVTTWWPQGCNGPVWQIRCSVNTVSAGSTFANPMINGMRVDRCLSWAQQCDEPAASAYCRSQGFSHATSWKWEYTAPTVVQSSGQVCNDPSGCGGFSLISCE